MIRIGVALSVALLSLAPGGRVETTAERSPVIAAADRHLKEAPITVAATRDVSTRKLDVMVDAAMAADGTIGARMTGGGFGGCTVNLVRAKAAPAFARQVALRYEARTERAPKIYTCTAAQGAGPA